MSISPFRMETLLLAALALREAALADDREAFKEQITIYGLGLNPDLNYEQAESGTFETVFPNWNVEDAIALAKLDDPQPLANEIDVQRRTPTPAPTRTLDPIKLASLPILVPAIPALAHAGETKGALDALALVGITLTGGVGNETYEQVFPNWPSEDAIAFITDPATDGKAFTDRLYAELGL